VQLRSAVALLVLMPLMASCRESATAPQPPRISLDIVGENVIHAAPGSMLPQPLRVVARNAATGAPASGIAVDWRVSEGTATLAATASTSDEYGIAEVQVMAGASGTSIVTATAPRLQGAAPRIQLHSVPRGIIDSIEPSLVAAGGEVVITGQNFAATAAENVVLFDGVRGAVVAATTTTLRVVTPACLPNRTVAVQAGVGYAVSTPAFLAVSGSGDGGTVALVPGQARALSAPADLACIRLAAEPDAQHLLIAHNVAAALSPPHLIELRALGSPPPIAAYALRAGAAPFAQSWEAALRMRERSLPPPADGDQLPHVRAAAAVPSPGDRRDFNVYNTANTFDKVTAEVRVVSERAIIYVDLESADAFSSTNLQFFADLFDDPIYPTVVDVFGQPSDIDSNGRVLILFTPRVNALTPGGSSSFVAGYFYGCDLVSRTRCSGTNQAEVFYSMVPDPSGIWGDRRSVANVLAAVPPILAHEFQHMIHFARRGFSADVLWLSEALAHTAEELAGQVFEQRGEILLAEAFRSGNIARARHYLALTDETSLVSEDPPGSLAVRGGAWLLLKYLRGHYGDNQLLHRLTGSTRTGAANVAAEIGRSWDGAVTDFSVAIWADGAPDLTGILAPEHTFVGFAPRSELLYGSGYYPLEPAILPWGDFTTSVLLPPASSSYALVQAPSSPASPLSFVLSGGFGVPVTSPDVRLTLLRVR
jgi:hypothetical protein